MSSHNSVFTMALRRDNPFPDGRFPPLSGGLAPMGPGVPTGGPQPLSPENIENLKRSIQLLRISQLRYVVQKFSLPANGNKTRLLRLVLQLIDAMVGSPLLNTISAEVMSLLAQQHEPFTNPLESMHKITLLQPGSAVPSPPRHPMVEIENHVVLCGPLVVPPGNALGVFSFESPRVRARCCIDFAWQKDGPSPLDMNAQINGFPITVCGDDPRPGPIDITDYILPRPQLNVLDFRLVKSQAQVVICVREYELQTVPMLMAKVAGKQSVDPLNDVISVKGKKCGHMETVPLGPYLAQAIVTGKWQCPICKESMMMDEIVVVSYVPNGHDSMSADDWDQFLVAQ